MAICKLPKNITCILEDGYNNDLSVFNGFGNSLIDTPTINATFAFSNQIDVKLFMMWVIYDLSNGAMPFVLDIPIFGQRLFNRDRDGESMDGWLVAFANTDFLQTKLKGFTSEISVKLILKDNISDEICKFERKDC